MITIWLEIVLASETLIHPDGDSSEALFSFHVSETFQYFTNTRTFYPYISPNIKRFNSYNTIRRQYYLQSYRNHFQTIPQILCGKELLPHSLWITVLQICRRLYLRKISICMSTPVATMNRLFVSAVFDSSLFHVWIGLHTKREIGCDVGHVGSIERNWWHPGSVLLWRRPPMGCKDHGSGSHHIRGIMLARLSKFLCYHLIRRTGRFLCCSTGSSRCQTRKNCSCCVCCTCFLLEQYDSNKPLVFPPERSLPSWLLCVVFCDGLYRSRESLSDKQTSTRGHDFISDAFTSTCEWYLPIVSFLDGAIEKSERTYKRKHMTETAEQFECFAR